MQDANYNVTAIFDNAGNVVERYVYDLFGQVTILDAGWNVLASSPFGWVYLHQGGRFDATTGLYHFRHRDYSPTLGRWMSLDPIRYAAGDVNLYRYVGNTPTVFTDPSGLDKFWLFDGKVKGPLYLLPGGENIWSDAWSLVFPKRSREYLKSPLHQNFNPDQTNRPGLKAGDIIDRDTRDWHNQAVQGLKSTLAEAGVNAAVVVFPWGRAGHIFRDAPGHVNPSSQATKNWYAGLFKKVASNPANRRADAVAAGIITQEAEKQGVIAFTETLKNGKQVWVTVRNNEIVNAGINEVGKHR